MVYKKRETYNYFVYTKKLTVIKFDTEYMFSLTSKVSFKSISFPM